MELMIGEPLMGRHFMVESDEENESCGQVRRRLAGYEDCQHIAYLVARSPGREVDVLRLRDNPRVSVTTIDRCLTAPRGCHWRSCRGEAGHAAKPVA